MSQISFVNAYSIDPYSNAQMQKRYLRHKQKIQEISKKSSPFSSIEQQQMRIIEAVHRSKQIARRFHVHQTSLRQGTQNKRMIDHLSRFESRKNYLEQPDDSAFCGKRNLKKSIMMQFEVELEDKNRTQRLQQCNVNKKKYKERIRKDIAEYQKLRNHMQRFKTVKSTILIGVNRNYFKTKESAGKHSNKILPPSFLKNDTDYEHGKKSRSLPPIK